MSNSNNEVPLELQNLADLVGQFIQYWGFKKIHGEIWTHIWLAKSPIDATTLVKRLNVSKALVSLAIKDLLQYDVIKTSTEGDRRKILLLPNKDVQTVIINVLKARESKLMNEIIDSQTNLEKSSVSFANQYEIDVNQLESMKTMTVMAQLALDTLISNNLDVKS
ncbi:MAG: hypothetical protein ACK4VO_05090 [Pseudobdellovibrio sp.]